MWLVKGAAGAWPDIYSLFREDSSLLNKRDFISGFTVLHWIAKHGDHRVLNTLWYVLCISVKQEGFWFHFCGLSFVISELVACVINVFLMGFDVYFMGVSKELLHRPTEMI